MNIHHYTTSGNKDLILDYIMSLSKPETVDGLSVLECLEKNELERLTTKQWRGKILEVYYYKHNRMFYVVIDDTDVYILHACRKQKNRTGKLDGEIVLKRAKELGVQLSKQLI